MEKPSRTTFRVRLETMVHQLREDILSGTFAPGSYLPSEDVLGEQFLLSKKSVRKGLEELVNEGLIVKKPKIGNMVLKPSEASGRTSIRLCYYPEVDQEIDMGALLDMFERKHPHIQVKRMTMNTDHYADQAIEFMEEQMLDVVLLNYYDFKHFHETSRLHMLMELPIDEAIYPFLNRAFTIDDRSYVKPFSFSPVILCYNRRHFQEAGLTEPDSSWTWNDFYKAAEVLSRIGEEHKRLGFFFYPYSSNRWPLWLLQHDFQLQRNEEDQLNLRSEPFTKSIHTLKELFTNEYTAPSLVFESSQDPERLFAEERTSMIVTTYFRLNQLKQAAFEYDISPVPYVETPKTLLLNVGIGISSQSAHKEAAKLLVDFLTSKEAQMFMRNQTLSIPSVKEAAQSERQDKQGEPKRYQMFREIMPSYRYYTDMNMTRSQLTAMVHYLKLYWAGLETASNAIASIEQALNQELAEHVPT